MNTHQQKQAIAKLGLSVEKTSARHADFRWRVIDDDCRSSYFRTRQEIIDHFTPKKGRPKTGQDPMMWFRCPEDVAEIISAYMKEGRVKRSDAIRALIRMGGMGGSNE